MTDHRKYLSKDIRLKRILPSLEEVVLKKQKNIYLRLCSSILSQQLSVKVARVLYQRFMALYAGETPSADDILQTPPATLQKIGFSRAKSLYVHNVCNFFIKNRITDKLLYSLTDEEVLKLLTQIKGVGKWTVEMILIFTLAREDIFPVDDLGIRNTMIDLYKIRETDKKKLDQKLILISDKWSPYRTYASRYLWMWKDAGGL
jgi:DNA-3-methyladenine glycosylase II